MQRSGSVSCRKMHASLSRTSEKRHGNRLNRYGNHILADAEKSAGIEKNKLMYIAGAENKARLIKIREELFSSAFNEAKLRLSSLRKDPEYPDIFKKLTLAAAGALGSGPFHAHVDKRDEELCRKTLASSNLHAEIIPDLNSAGGIVVSLPEGSVIHFKYRGIPAGTCTGTQKTGDIFDPDW